MAAYDFLEPPGQGRPLACIHGGMRVDYGSALALLAFSLSLSSQVRPHASHVSLPELSVGSGFSAINPDYGSGKLYGETIWVDCSPIGVVPIARRVGIEIEVRELRFLRSPSERILREDVGLAGVTYALRSFSRLQPYLKAEWGLGNLDYLVRANRSYHQSRTVTNLGGGLEWRAFGAAWIRADYAYEFYPDFFLGIPQKPTSGSVAPQGVTVGLMFQIRPRHTSS